MQPGRSPHSRTRLGMTPRQREEMETACICIKTWCVHGDGGGGVARGGGGGGCVCVGERGN